MIQTISRRFGLKLVALLALFGLVPKRRTEAQAASSKVPQLDEWSQTHDRVWLGGDFWANPMEDWRIRDGWAECQTRGANRSIHALTHQITNPKGSFSMSVQIGWDDLSKLQGGAGFRLGVRSDINEYRSNTFAKGGIDAGCNGRELLLARKKQPLGSPVSGTEVHLLLTGQPKGDLYELTLKATTPDLETELGSLTETVPLDRILGNVAVVSQFSGPARRDETRAFRFQNWKAGGEAFTISPEHRFGPLLWSMYSLSDSRSDEGFVLKLSALTGPLGKEDSKVVDLQVQQDGQWVSQGEAPLDPEAWVATFRIPHWNAKKDTPYRLAYREPRKDGTIRFDQWSGTIKASPEGRPLRLGALTCQNDYAYPYEPVANNLVKLDPDLLYFSGDQLYESHGGFGIIRDPAPPAILNYLRKFYQFGWAFREAMRNSPTLCIPDDHDVFQGNIWGEGGAPMKDLDKGASSKGGYREPARMVNVVHKTNTGHHPDPFDPTPCLQDISVYYGDMVYGGVSFAILGDRQWKSGPERVDTGEGRADHIPDPEFDTTALDQPGLVLLGERQEEFLRQWAKDWRGHTMKVLLSQTVFAGVATHHGRNDPMYLKGDLDSGAWPQTPRNRAIDLLRPAKALHVNGDQHLTTLCQYGVNEQRDSSWSFCTPAIAAGYPRFWLPDELGMPHQNRPRHGLANTGEFRDGFENLVYVYAVGNPERGTEKHRYELAHQKGSGFGLVVIDTEKRTYRINSFRFLIDATDGKASNQFPGWPVTIHQKENGGENVLG